MINNYFYNITIFKIFFGYGSFSSVAEKYLIVSYINDNVDVVQYAGNRIARNLWYWVYITWCSRELQKNKWTWMYILIKPLISTKVRGVEYALD